ncbi:MAG TPA: hypothetical protein DHW71_03640 [Gammaproteobacteria bacterium]|nr:hypothetical protein [Gammaproteobacteria bacterium]MEC8011382.1 DnaJ domain-containing protein [Pseudomonadota bacterium]HBF08561.1 hypothetical protein [Gammaproteobacteria bacterium]HCK92051.1 hypothetical protein [Gammaproteobacteria bacterium]|tara:strand:- start:172 stop:498 length:327 start_codon:yes stop_codon:yes gene_type:complete
MLSRLFGILLILGLFWAFKRYISQKPGNHHSPNNHNSKKTDENITQVTPDRAEALSILGLKDPVTSSEINAAYKRLMNKVHPDKGGSAHFATQLNKAKKILLQGKQAS